MDTNMQLNLPLHLEYQSLNVNSGLDKGMAAKRHHILAKCYDRKGRLLSAAFNSSKYLTKDLNSSNVPLFLSLLAFQDMT